MLEELQKRSAGDSIHGLAPAPPKTPLRRKTSKALKAENLEATLAEYGDKEITAENIVMTDPAMVALKEMTRSDQAFKPQHSGIIDRSALLGMLDEKAEQVKKMCDEASRNGPGSITANVNIGPWRLFSTAITELLKPIPLSNMLITKTHKGNSVLGRTIRLPLYDGATAILLAIEDFGGNNAYVKLFNYAPLMNATQEEREAVFPVGTTLIIREPTYVIDSSDQTFPFIKVDTPSDLYFFDMDVPQLRGVPWKTTLTVTPQPSTGEAWRAAGLKSFKAKEWFFCAVAFTKCMKFEYNIQLSRLNRSEAYLRLGWYNSAYHDSNNALNSGTLTEDLKKKAIIRMVKAQYALHRYKEILAIVKALPNDADVIEWSRKASQRIKEQETGNYDWDMLYREDKIGYSPDIANYTGPVEVKTGNNGLRGTFVTRDVKVGELLIFHKALSAWTPGDNKGQNLGMSLRRRILPMNGIYVGRDMYLALCKVVMECWDNRNLYERVLSLYGGAHINTSPKAYPPTFIKLADDPPLKHPTMPAVDIDIEYIDGAFHANTFGLKDNVGKGLFGLQSLINHACLPTAHKQIVGDAMVIRAKCDMKKGEEVTVAYLPLSASYDERRFRLMRSWKFKCSCVLCEADSKDEYALRARRRAIKIELDQLNDGYEEASEPKVKQIVAQANKLCEELKNTYNESHSALTGGVKTEMTYALNMHAKFVGHLAHVTSDTSMKKHAIELRMDALDYSGLKVIDRSLSGPLPKGAKDTKSFPIDMSRLPGSDQEFIMIWIVQIVKAFHSIKQLERSQYWMDAAVHLGTLYTGGGAESFMVLNK